ncbi:MAG TPA: circadian clock KaiB family protein [Ideonella sp.]|uniref:circadian clock KaiB family protein n=1 Tax=Ideonella sp. TaxID=1929293 RepID=UPI002E3559BE|nr:circadian clock KaiB family protein [Ideonella sp.]HEX5682804.1 circadian clock KaiB family protein [Ideonella sp.]
MLHHRLCLYVVGTTPSSSRAIVNVRKLCEEHLESGYDLQVVDISQNPSIASQAQVIAAPTLVRELPPPERRFIGDMSDTARLLSGLGLTAPPAPETT